MHCFQHYLILSAKFFKSVNSIFTVYCIHLLKQFKIQLHISCFFSCNLSLREKKTLSPNKPKQFIKNQTMHKTTTENFTVDIYKWKQTMRIDRILTLACLLLPLCALTRKTFEFISEKDVFSFPFIHKMAKKVYVCVFKRQRCCFLWFLYLHFLFP